MNKIIEIILKNFKLLVRNRLSSIFMLVGPLFIILIVGVAFDNQTVINIKVGVYSEVYSDLSQQYMKNLESQSFIIEKFISENSCIDSVKRGDTHACVVFSPNLRIENQEQGYIHFYVDYSQINTAWIIKDIIFSPAEQVTKEITQDIVTELLSFVELTTTEIDKSKNAITQITTINDKISSSLSSTSSFLSVVDTSYDFNKLRMNEIKSKISSILSSSSEISSFTLTKLDEIKQNLGQIDSYASGINESSIQNQIKSTIAKMNTDIDSYKSSISINDQNLRSQINELSSLIKSLDSNINDLEEKLAAIELSKQKSSEAVTQAKTDTANLLSVIFTLQKSLVNIEKRIDEITILSSERVTEPFQTEIKSVVKESTGITFLFPTILSIIILFLSIIISSTTVQVEKNSTAHLRNLVTPTKTINISLGDFLSSLIIVVVQILIILTLISLFFDFLNIFSYFWITLLITILSSSVFIFIGILIGSLFNSEQASLTISVAVSIVLLVFSGVIYPIETLPVSIQGFMRTTPLYLTNYLYRQVLIQGTSINEIGMQFLILTCWNLALFVILLILQAVLDERYLEKKTIFFLHSTKKKKKKNQNESETFKELKKMVDEINEMLSPKRKVTREEINDAKRQYLKIISLYQKLSKQEKLKIYDEVNLIHKKLSAF